MENKYQDGKIYMIESVSASLRYYGSTCQTLCRRMADHRNNFKLKKSPGLTSFKVLEHSDARILLVETFPCNNKNELTAREAYYIRNNVCVNKMMKFIGRTAADHRYYINNKESRLKASALYYRKNRDLRLSKMIEKTTEALAVCMCDSPQLESTVWWH